MPLLLLALQLLRPNGINISSCRCLAARVASAGPCVQGRCTAAAPSLHDVLPLDEAALVLVLGDAPHVLGVLPRACSAQQQDTHTLVTLTCTCLMKPKCLH